MCIPRGRLQHMLSQKDRCIEAHRAMKYELVSGAVAAIVPSHMCTSVSLLWNKSWLIPSSRSGTHGDSLESALLWGIWALPPRLPIKRQIMIACCRFETSFEMEDLAFQVENGVDAPLAQYLWNSEYGAINHCTVICSDNVDYRPLEKPLMVQLHKLKLCCMCQSCPIWESSITDPSVFRKSNILLLGQVGHYLLLHEHHLTLADLSGLPCCMPDGQWRRSLCTYPCMLCSQFLFRCV